MREDPMHPAHPPRPVMRAYNPGSTEGNASGRENTA